MLTSGPAWLVALSLGLLVVGVATYGASLPSLLAELPEGAAVHAVVAGAAEVSSADGSPDGEKDAGAASDSASEGAPDSGADAGPAAATDPDATDPSADGPGSEDSSEADDATSEDTNPEGKDDADASGDDTSSEDAPSNPGATTPSEPSTPTEPSKPAEPSRPSTSDDPLNGYPTDAEEQATHAWLKGKADAAPGFLSKANAVASAFASDASSASLDTRLSRQRTCNALSSQLWAEYYDVRDTAVTNRSRYKKAQENLIGMYRCLAQYVDTYGSAWELNVALEDPAGREADYMGPINSNGAGSQNRYLQEYYTWQGGLSL